MSDMLNISPNRPGIPGRFVHLSTSEIGSITGLSSPVACCHYNLLSQADRHHRI